MCHIPIFFLFAMHLFFSVNVIAIFVNSELENSERSSSEREREKNRSASIIQK